MDASIIFSKTTAGEHELAEPLMDLATDARQVLVLIKDSRTVGDLALLMAGQADVRPILRDLLAKGLITTTSSVVLPTAEPAAPAERGGLPPLPNPSAPAPSATHPPAQPPAALTAPAAAEAAPAEIPSPATAAPAAAPTPDDQPVDLDQTKRRRVLDGQGVIRREVEQIFGGDADPILAKINACETVTELMILATKVRDIAANYTSDEEANLFLARVRNRLEDSL